MFNLFRTILRKQDTILSEIRTMAANLDRLKADMTTFLSTLSDTLTDIQDKLNAIPSGDPDDEVGAVADQMEGAIKTLTDFKAKVDGTDQTGVDTNAPQS